MTAPEPHDQHEPPRPADPGRASRNTPDDRLPVDRVVNPETAFGGADAVEKTSYVVGRGTDPSDQAHGEVNAHPRPGDGPNYLAWGVGAVAALIAIFYLLSLIS